MPATVTVRPFNPARAALSAAVNRAIAEGAPIYENMPRPTVSLAKPAPRRKRRVLAWEISEMLDRDFDDMEICGSLATLR